jgi:hypothetical protein
LSFLSLTLIDTTREPGPQVAASVKNQFGFNAVALCDRLIGEIHVAGAEDLRLERDMVHSVAIGEPAPLDQRLAGMREADQRLAEELQGSVPNCGR